MSNIDPMRVANEEQYCGFFNEAYHETYWDHGSRDDPTLAKVSPKWRNNMKDAVYLRTTEAAPPDIAVPPEDNPVIDTASWAPAPKGIILSACNALIYKSARTTWSQNFERSVIIGTVTRIASGTWVTRAIAGAAMTTEAFWRDPQSILDEDGKCTELEQQLNQNFHRKNPTLGVLYKGIYYKGGTASAV